MMESSHLVSFVKRTRGDLIEEARKEGKAIGIGEGLELGRKDAIVSVAKRMLMRGRDIDLISECTGLSIEEINILKNNFDR